MRRAARTPSSVCVGGMRMSTTATSGLSDPIACIRSTAFSALRDDLEAGVCEHARDTLAHEGRIVSDRDAQGAHEGDGSSRGPRYG